MMTAEQIWVSVGLFGQFLFSCRWLVQWLTSERMQKSVIPLAFWYLSIAGSLTLLSYALYREDPVFILGHVANSVVYVRNLHLFMRERRANAA